MTGSSSEVRAAAEEVSEQFNLPHFRLRGDETLALGRLMIHKDWVASGLVSRRALYHPVRQGLIRIADRIVVVPCLEEHFLPSDTDRLSPEAVVRYEASVRSTAHLVDEARAAGKPAYILPADSSQWLAAIAQLDAAVTERGSSET